MKNVFSFKLALLVLLSLLTYFAFQISSTLKSIQLSIGKEGYLSKGTGLIGAIEQVSDNIGHSGQYASGSGATGLYKAILDLKKSSW